MVAHTLGNPFDLDAVLAFAKKHDLWVVEDNCDALGSTYRGKLTGSFGDFGTLSFYPAHHITMGEGGAVLTNRPQLKLLIESFRDWGRDCWCEPGEDNTCGMRFDQQLGKPAARLRPQVHLHPRRLQPEGHRHAGRGRRRAARQAAGVRRGAASATGSCCTTGSKPFEDVLLLPRATRAQRAELVRLPAHDPRRCAVRPQRAGPPSRGAEDRDAASVRRQPDSPAGVRGSASSGRSASCRTATSS